MKKILMVAFSCQPGKGSEPGVGWNWALQAAKSQDVWVLTRSKMKPYIEPAIPEELKTTLHFCYAPSSKRLRSMTIYLEYLAWQHTAYRYAKRICKENAFDYVWHITWGNMFLPTYMYKLGVPFIWGPNGAAEQIPKCFWNLFPLKNRLIHKAKYYMGKHIMQLPWVRKPAEKAKIMIARTTDTKNLFPPQIQAKTFVHLESLVSPVDFYYPSETPSILNRGKINYIYTGRIIDIKNTNVLVETMKKVIEIQPEARLHIVGAGNFEPQLRKKIAEAKMEKSILMYGQVPRIMLLKAVSECDGFFFPSLREGASWSLLEAMYYAKPIVAFDANGMHDTVSSECAIMASIDADDADKTNRNFVAEAINLVKLSDDEKAAMGEMGKKRLETHFYAPNIEVFISNVINL